MYIYIHIYTLIYNYVYILIYTWDVYYVVLAIALYIPRTRVYWQRIILKGGANLPVKLPKCWLINSGKRVFHSTLTLLGKHKYKPHDEAEFTQPMEWRLKNKDLQPHCTTKESYVGSRSHVRRVVHFIVAITHQKGALWCKQYERKINEDMLSDFIKTHFQEPFSQRRIAKDERFL